MTLHVTMDSMDQVASLLVNVKMALHATDSMETAHAHLVLLDSIAVMNVRFGGMGTTANKNAHASKISQTVAVTLMEHVSAKLATVEKIVKRIAQTANME